MGDSISYFCFPYFKSQHLVFVGKIKGILNKISKKLALWIVGIYGLYLIFSFYKIYDQSGSILTFIKNVWSYQIYQSSNVTITLGKTILLFGFLIFSFFMAKIIVNNILHKILDKTKLDIGAKSAIENLSSYVLTFIFIIIALSMAEIPLTAFTFIGGALAIGFGFGTQNILNNFISGIILQIEKPIKVGDFIDLDPIVKGRVEEIGTRSTKIILANNTYTIVPNSVLLEKSVTNWNFKDQTYRSKITFNFVLGSDHKKIYEILKGALDTYKEKIKTSPDYQIYLSEINGHGLSFEIYFWIDREYVDRARLESDIRVKVLEDCIKNKIEFYTQK